MKTGSFERFKKLAVATHTNFCHAQKPNTSLVIKPLEVASATLLLDVCTTAKAGEPPGLDGPCL